MPWLCYTSICHIDFFTATFLQENEGRVDVELKDEGGENIAEKFGCTEPVRFFAEQSAVGGEFKGYMTHMNGQQSFYIQQSADTELIDKTQADVATECSDSRPLPAVRVGQACIAQYSGDGVWNRAQVLSIDSNGTCVQFVDYGNEEVVRGNVLQISDTLVQVPPLALHCCLSCDVPSKDLFAWAGEGEFTTMLSICLTVCLPIYDVIIGSFLDELTVTVLSVTNNLVKVKLINSSGDPFNDTEAVEDVAAKAVGAMRLSEQIESPTAKLSPAKRVFPRVNVPAGRFLYLNPVAMTGSSVS